MCNTARTDGRGPRHFLAYVANRPKLDRTTGEPILSALVIAQVVYGNVRSPGSGIDGRENPPERHSPAARGLG